MEHLINLNFAPGGLPATVHVSQYDDTIRQLRFQLWFGRSKVEVPSGTSVRVDIKKPDGHIVLVNGTVNSSDRSIVTVPTTKQMTAVPGGSRGTLVVSSTGDKRISSAIFILQVHRDPVEDGDASDSDLSMLQDAIDQTAANASAAQAAATAAQQAAESFTVDSTLDSTSTNAIQNKAVAAGFAAINESLGDVRTDLGALSSQIRGFVWTSGQYIPTNIDPVDVSDIQTNDAWKYILIGVSPGEQYTLAHVSSGIAARAWCITDASGNVLDVADSMTDYAEQVITIPELGAYLIVHAYVSTENANATAVGIKTRVDKLEAEIEETKGLIEDSTLITTIPCDIYDMLLELLENAYYRTGSNTATLNKLKTAAPLYVYDGGLYISKYYAGLEPIQSCRTLIG